MIVFSPQKRNFLCWLDGVFILNQSAWIIGRVWGGHRILGADGSHGDNSEVNCPLTLPHVFVTRGTSALIWCRTDDDFSKIRRFLLCDNYGSPYEFDSYLIKWNILTPHLVSEFPDTASPSEVREFVAYVNNPKADDNDPDAVVKVCPESKVHGANMGPIWGRQDPGGPHVGPMNFAIWAPVSGWLYELRAFVAVVFIIYVDIGVISRYLGYGLVIISHRTMWDVTSCNYLYMT